MREELNAELLRKIRCCEAGEVLGRILMYIFFFATILYLVAGKVYKPVKYMIKEIYLNLKNKKNRKFQLWLIIAILGGMVGIGEYSVCYVKANSVVEDVIEGDTESTEDAEEIEVKTNPKLAIYSEQWVEGKGDFTNYLFSRENRFITLQLEEKAFEEDVEDEEEGEFLFQVSEKRENLSKITNYEKKDFIKSNEEQPIYQKILNFEGEEEEEKLYDVSFKYINKWGLPLVGIEGQENRYGEIISGLFKSKKLVLDRKCPEIKEIQIEKAGEVGNTIKKKYFNGSIKGTVNIKEAYLDFDSVHIWAMPLDEKAKKLTEQAEGRNNESGVDILSWKHTKEKDSIQISFNFFMEGKWKFYFNCLDMAGNKGVSVTTQEQVAESEEFFIDNTAPKLKVSYTGRLNILDKESSLANVNKKIQNNKGKITSSQNQIFAKRDNEVIIEIKETNINPEDIEIKLYSIAYGADGELEETELSEKDLYNKIIRKINNPKSGSEWENEVVYSIRNLQDGHYKIRVYCEDKAGNRMIAEKNSETDRCLYNGWYQSPLYTIDTMPPIITEVYCNEAAVRKIGKRKYFRNAPQIIIRIQEENFNRGNFSLSGKLFYANGKSMDKEWKYLEEKLGDLQWKSYYKDGIRMNETSVNVDIEANYIMDFQSIDGAMHTGNQKRLEITYDCTKPEISYNGEIDENKDLIFKPKINKGQNREVQTDFFTFRRYSFFRYFSKKRIYAFIRVKDEISGVERTNYRFIPYRGEEKDKEEWITSQNIRRNKGGDEAEDKDINIDLSEMSVIALPDPKNFKGYLNVYGEDYSGNKGENIKSKGIISEDIALHKDMSGISIKMPKAVFIDKENNIKYYNKTIPVEATFEDKQSGIYKTELYGTIRSLSGKSLEEETKNQVGNSVMWDTENIVYRKKQRIILDAEKFCQSDANHPLIIRGKMTDNAGHVSEKHIEQNIVLDKIKPEIKVEYDNNNKTGYYNVPRKAVVTVKERNFAPDFVKWDIRGSNRNYRIGEWKVATEGAVDRKITKDRYWCEIYFEGDGEGYAINLSVSDYAGNRSEWKDRECFTIDRTPPRLSIKIEDEKDTIINKVEDVNRMVYFNVPKVVILCIEDKNFDKNRVNYDIKATEGGKQIRIENTEKYIKDNSKYYNRFIFEKEASYHIAIKCTDKAGNESQKKELTFVIDTTAPQIIIKGVKNDAIYDGNVIMPEVTCTDKYLEADSIKARIINVSGGIQLSREEWHYEKLEDKEKQKVKFQWNNLPEKKKNDGIYQLLIWAKDKAGNGANNISKVTFRVNRWGANFILSDKLKRKIDGRYLREAPQIRLKEQCVKKTKSKVTVLKNNEERRIPESKSIKEYIIADKKSEKYGWYEKDYNIKKDNFTEEGDYRVTFQADSKKKQIHFIVDKTPPIVSINGLESELYEEKEHEFTLNIMDNYAFEKMELYIENNYKKPDVHNFIRPQKIIIKPEDLDKNHMFRQKIKESVTYQTIRYIAWDKAGNKTDSDENGDTRKCLITPNKAVKQYYNHKSNYTRIAPIGMVVLVILLAGGGIGVKYIIPYVRKRSRKDKSLT